ncbi:hypothetical protein RchiOBHm_Chr1g0321731 [Rosa chinensis]|uniref:Uncharacterized protein n=1 Tax=Rosa chinensis TaxID=74649 RepID=A0A2P6S945_ROSCH|nr:hypothetical protein RchiOBHm_Chr1g0321731 [Rosa chinensis]
MEKIYAHHRSLAKKVDTVNPEVEEDKPSVHDSVKSKIFNLTSPTIMIAYIKWTLC